MQSQRKAQQMSGRTSQLAEPSHQTVQNNGNSQNTRNTQLPRNGQEWAEADDAMQAQMMGQVLFDASHFFNQGFEPKEYRLVDFPEFRGGNQDPIEWLEAFEKACTTNRI